MKIKILNSKNHLVFELTKRSDHMGYPEMKDFIAGIIMEYCMPERGYRVVITGETLPHDPNTKDEREKMAKRFRIK